MGEIEILEDIENPLLHRREIKFKTPNGLKRAEIREKLASILNADPNLLVIHWVKTQFGRNYSVGYAKLYSSKEKMEEIEMEHILARNFGGKDGGK